MPAETRLQQRRRIETQAQETGQDATPPSPPSPPLSLPPFSPWTRRHHKLYFDDGNIVIAASDLRFRVHTGILGHHSEVFKDMFSIPQPEESEMYDGCPEMVLYDAPEAVETLLEHMYSAGDRSVVSIQRTSRTALLTTISISVHRSWYDRRVPVSFTEAWSRFMLGDKYQVKTACAEALWRIRQAFPGKLEDYDRLEQESKDGMIKPLYDFMMCDSIAVVQLARTHHIPDIAPLAYYNLSLMDGHEAMQTVTYGSTREEVRLDRVAVSVLIAVKKGLYLVQSDLLSIVVNPKLAEGCETQVHCLTALLALLQMLVGDGWCSAPKFHPFRNYEVIAKDLKERMMPDERWCNLCDATLMSRLRQYRTTTWSSITGVNEEVAEEVAA